MSRMEREVILRGALEDALEGMQEMLPYVPEYFVRKHALADYIEHAQDALEATYEVADEADREGP